jgi:hypothetical protein
MNKQGILCLLCFDISNLEEKTIPVDNCNKPKLENRRKHVKLKGIKNTLNIWRPCWGTKM